AFKPVVGKSLLSSVTAVEFLLDRQLDFLSDLSAFQPYQDEVDSLNPVLRDNHQLHDEVRGWLKDQKVQEIFMQGPYSLNGYRVRVYRQDSATQWFTGIITHHDLFSRNMVVLEPQNVDPSMIQMTFLDDVVHSLLKGENIGITSRRRSRSSTNNNNAHMAGGRPSGTTGSTQSHYTRAQANSPRPIMNSSGPNAKGSQGTQASQQQSQSQQSQQTASQSHNSPGGNAREQREQRNARSSRRKGSDSSVPEEDKREEPPARESKKAKQAVNKRRKGEEEEKKASLKRLKTDITSDLSESSDSENPLNKREEEEKPLMPANKMNDSSSLIGRLSPWAELQEDTKKGVVKETSKITTKEEEELVAVTQITQSPRQQTPVMPDSLQAGSMESSKNTVKASSQSQTPAVSQPGGAVTDITEEAQATVHQESSEAVSALLASQNAESTALSPYLPLNPSPVSSPPVPPSPSPSEGGRKAETELSAQQQQHGLTGGGTTAARSSGNKMEFAPSEVIRPVTSMVENVLLVEKEKHETRKPPQQHPPPNKMNAAIPPDFKSKTSPNPAQLDSLKQKPRTPTTLRAIPTQTQPQLSLSKLSPTRACWTSPNPNPTPPQSQCRCGWSRVGVSSTKSPFIIDKNETFTVYRDPALVRSAAENSVSVSISSNHRVGSPWSASPSRRTPAAVPSGAQGPPLLAQAHSGAAGLGLYPILWQYPNGTPSSYPPGLNLPPTAKWVHPDNPVNSEVSLRRNTASPWLHQAGGGADGLGLLSHVPVRPASADPHRPSVKMNTHASPPLSKASMNAHKEEMDKKGFVDPIRTLTLAQLKQEQSDRSRTPTGKEVHLHRLYMDPHSKARMDAVQAADRASKYKEENRQILKESIEVAPYTAKIQRSSDPGMDRDRERSRDPAFPVRVPALSSPNPKAGHIHPHVIQSEKSNYFTTLSNSVVNEPPRLYSSKELSSYYENVSSGAPGVVASIGAAVPSQGALSLGSYSSKASLSKPPPLIKHQPEGGEGLAGKINEQLSQQPVSLAAAGSKTLAEQQKPPTLLPELRDTKGHGNAAVVTSVAAAISGEVMTSSADAWRDRGGSFSGEKGMSRGKPQSAMASVIVRPSTSIKYDIPVGANKYSAMIPKELPQGRFYSSKLQGECLRRGEGFRDVGRIIQPNSNLDDMCVQYNNTSMRSMHGMMGASMSNSVCRTISPAFGIQSMSGTALPELGYSSSAHISSHKTGIGGWVLSHSGPGEYHEVLRTTSPGGSLPPPSPAGTPQPSPSITPTPSSVSGSSQPYSPSFVHLKKHKAALAAAQSRTNFSSAPTAITTGNCFLPVDSADKTPIQNSPPLPSSSQASSSSVDSSSNSSVGGSTTTGKSSPLPNGQSSVSSSVQPSNYHKLKKAWLTRHSEEDRNTTANTTPPSVKPEKRSGDEQRQRGNKRTYESASESGGDDSDASESKMEGRAKRQPKPTYKKKQNDMAKKKGDNEKEEDDLKPNGIFRSAREKTKLKLASSNGIPRSVLKDWRKVKKLKQTGESFLQDDSCAEIGPNLQKCRECRVIRSKKGEEPAHSPVFCRFYYFRRLSFSKNGVLRMDGFSNPEQFDDEALSLWVPGLEDTQLDQNTAKYILSFIGDKFCQMVVTENTAATWVKKDAKVVWKRAVRGVREMCDACEATLFNIHWVCQKCGFVVCLDCYKAKERRSSKDKELYGWLKCVKGQPHDHKHLMPTQIIPGTVLADLVSSMHSLREKHNIKSHCPCSTKQNLLTKLPATNGVSQVLQNVLNHSNKLSVLKTELGSQQNSDQGGTKVETNGGGGGSSPSSDAGSAPVTPPESQSPLHFLADLAEQKSREEKKENKSVVLGKSVKEDKVGDSLEVLQQCKTTSLVANSTEQGSTLRDLLTTTAGKLKMGSTDAGIAFAPVYCNAAQHGKGGRTMPNILDEIIASVVENKIPANRQNIASKLSSIKHEPVTPSNNNNPAPAITEDVKPDRKKTAVPAVVPEESTNQYPDIPHCWLNNRRLLWLKDHRNHNNWKLFRECWRQGQPVLVSGIHKRLNSALWKADSFNQEFADHQGDLLNCKDQVVSNSGIKEFWDGFEDITKRPKSKDGEPMVYRLKDWPSGEEFMALMPSRYDDLMKNLPLPEYSDPEGNLNLASHLPSFFVRPDLGPRLCCAYGVAASQDQDFGTANLHVEVSDVVSVLVYVGVAKGNGVLSKTGVLKRLEEEDLDEGVRRRLKDSSETPGALWHIYLNKDMEKVREFLRKEQSLDGAPEQDPIREQGLYLSRKQRQRLLEEQGVQGWTVVQFLGDSVLIPAGAMHQVQNLHSCVQVINDFVSPEHVANSFHLSQELRPNNEEVNYEDKLQVKNILFHCVKEAVSSLKRSSSEEDEEEENS
ncbi:putative JmjC domain containing histone demethylation protein 2C, partial [Dissostichus eleginoides]